MIEWADGVDRLMPILMWAAVGAAVTMAALVVLERSEFGIRQARSGRLTARYRPLVRRAMEGDEAARQALLRAPARHRTPIAWLVVIPLIENRTPEHLRMARAIMADIKHMPVLEGRLRSRMWWRRARGLRALGLLQVTDQTPKLVAALDDPHPDVRAAALDGLTDMHDPAALEAIVVRVHDASLHYGRRGAALKKLGSECEPMLLELAAVDRDNRLGYIQALAICGTGRSRPVLCGWMTDASAGVRAMALEALAHVGLDDASARVAIEGLDSDDPQVRAMAAFALRGWQGPGAAARLAAHLDDTWMVAVRAARSLQSMGPAGTSELQARASRPDLCGVLARQMLWRADAHHAS